MIPLGDDEYLVLSALVEQEAGLHMPASKRAFLASRLQRRLRHNGIADFPKYLALVGDPSPDGTAERQHMVSALTTNVTDIYREPHHFVVLADQLADWARRARVRSGRVLIWSAGCSSGEEPLSIAAICRTVLGPAWHRSVRILATDVDAAILNIARDRSDDVALAARLATIPPEFSSPRVPWPRDSGDLLAQLGSGITYLRHDLRAPLPVPGQFDMIFCRNVTIYFSPPVQQDVHRRLIARVAPGGILALGHSERLSADVPGLMAVGRTAFLRDPMADAARVQVAGCL